MKEYEVQDKQENILLTEEQIVNKSMKKYPKVRHTLANHYLDEEDIRQRQRSTYQSTWNECTEHYRELIEAGARQKEPVDKVDAVFYIIKGIQIMSELSDDEMAEIIDNVINRNKKAKQIDQL